MINKQRVQRIRGFIYTCMVLIIFIPIILMIVVSIKTLGFLTNLQDYMEKGPSAGITQQQQSAEQNDLSTGNENNQSDMDIQGQSFEASSPEQAPDQQVADNGTEPNGEEPPANDGRYVVNTYLPTSYPDLYFDTVPVLSPAEENMLYITIDNTPSSQASSFLGILEKHDVPATFFVWWNEYLDIENIRFYKRIVEAGHEIGIHSGNNTKTFSQLYTDVDTFLHDYNEIFQTIHAETGIKPRFYRLPGGSVNPYDTQRQQILYTIKSELDARGFLQYDWTASAQDAVSPSLTKDQILYNLRQSVSSEGRGVVLLHDGTGSTSTAEALDEFISQYKAEGYTFGVLQYDAEPVSFLGA